MFSLGKNKSLEQDLIIEDLSDQELTQIAGGCKKDSDDDHKHRHHHHHHHHHPKGHWELEWKKVWVWDPGK